MELLYGKFDFEELVQIDEYYVRNIYTLKDFKISFCCENPNETYRFLMFDRVTMHILSRQRLYNPWRYRASKFDDWYVVNVKELGWRVILVSIVDRDRFLKIRRISGYDGLYCE